MQEGTSGAATRKLTVWDDGACPLCSREIKVLKRLDRRLAIEFIDASKGQPQDCPVSQADLLARFHAREGDRLLSGAAAFAAAFRRIPLLRPVGELARLPLLDRAFERLYLLFLRVRPRLQRWAEGRG
jgi:predicted DCC family thiol-disulfide oxidoreductase YuxK